MGQQMINVWRLRSFFVVGFLLSLAPESWAQVRIITPEPPQATAERGFTHITGVRELSDGRLLVADQDENRLYAVGWATGAITEIGRRGEGPGEFRRIGRLYPIGSDSTLLTDAISFRWLILRGTEFVETVPSQRPLNQTLGSILHGGDLRGCILDTKGVAWQPNVPGRFDSNADSLAVILVSNPFDDAGEVAVDTIARIAAAGANASSIGACAGGAVAATRPGAPPRSRSTECVRNPIRAPDQVLLFPDGWIAIAYVDPYRVDWRDPMGRWIRGSPIPHTPVPMTSDEKCAAVRGWSFRGIASCGSDELDRVVWQETVPPFILPKSAMSGGDKLVAMFAAPDGSLLIRRTPSSRSLSSRYDLIDRAGRVVRPLELAANHAVVGFGASSLYTIRIDEVDLQWLSKRPWR